MFFCSVSWANNCENIKKMPIVNNDGYKIKNTKKDEKNQKENTSCKQEINEKRTETCSECELEDDEYFTYNQCFFDKKYRKIKENLILNDKQEEYIDNIYLNFKADMENLYFKYKKEKEKMLSSFSCNCFCAKESKRNLKEYKNEAKEKYKDFKAEVKEKLCKSQKKKFNTFLNKEKKNLAKLKKYCIVYKFPCTICNIE